MFPRANAVLLLTALLVQSTSAAEASLSAALETVQRVGALGAGNREAQGAWRVLATAPAGEVPQLLAALDDSEPLAANWIRAAVDAVCERSLQAGQALPADRLEQFVLDTAHNPRARRLAYEWLAKADATAPDRLIPGFLQDPSVELRRDAVARVLEQAKSGQGEEAKQLYRAALAGARDLDQVQEISGKLMELGDEVDLSRHFGFLFDWQVIGPFDNVGEKGFTVAYPPEGEQRLDAKYPGKQGVVGWQPQITTDEMGTLDFNTILGQEKGVIAYAVSEFVADKEQEVEFRWGTMNATKLWLNGELLAEYETYHSGIDLDQYTARGKLRPGKNVILVKVCQNEQTENWANTWQVQFRVCDAAGTAILSTNRPAKSPRKDEASPTT